MRSHLSLFSLWEPLVSVRHLNPQWLDMCVLVRHDGFYHISVELRNALMCHFEKFALLVWLGSVGILNRTFLSHLRIKREKDKSMENCLSSESLCNLVMTKTNRIELIHPNVNSSAHTRIRFRWALSFFYSSSLPHTHTQFHREIHRHRLFHHKLFSLRQKYHNDGIWP